MGSIASYWQNVEAIDNVQKMVNEEGKLFIAIYNKQKLWSPFWLIVKRLNNKNIVLKILMCILFFSHSILRGIYTSMNPIKEFLVYKQNRGMNLWNDWIDWLGGYPFEVASPEEVVDFLNFKWVSFKKN